MKNIIDWTAEILVLIGALNWGFTAAGHNLVSKLVPSQLQNIVYYAVAVAALYAAYNRYQWHQKQKQAVA